MQFTVVILPCLLVAVLADPQQLQKPTQVADKPQAFQHQSSLKDAANQHLDSKQESGEGQASAASAEEYRQLSSDEVKQLLLKVRVCTRLLNFENIFHK